MTLAYLLGIALKREESRIARTVTIISEIEGRKDLENQKYTGPF
jgi:hypothetical protein